MSYVVSQRRPGSVTWATYLLILVAVLVVIDGLVGVASIGALGQATSDAYRDAGFKNADSLGEAVQAAVIVGLVINILFGIGFLVLGIVNLQGRNAARIVTWVLAGLGVLCFGCGALGSATGSLTNGMAGSSPNGVDTAAINRRIVAHTPGWVTPVQTTLAVVSLLALIVVIVLLALPSSNAYFRTGGKVDGFANYPPLGSEQPYPPYGIQPYGGQLPPPGNEPPYPPYGSPPGGQPPYSGPPFG